MTERLILREWRDADVAPFIKINADPVVMEFFPQTLSEDRTRRFVDRIRTRWRQFGYSLWAVERKDSAAFIGYVGPLARHVSRSLHTRGGGRVAAGGRPMGPRVRDRRGAGGPRLCVRQA